jgi:hypothetical protein
MSREAPKTTYNPKANLGQNDANLQKLSSIQVRHMQGDKATELAKRQKSTIASQRNRDKPTSMP